MKGTTTPTPPVDMSAYIKNIVDAAPPLTGDQRARLAVLLSHRPPRGEARAA